ncbi:MAG: helix-turn-helix domain-containing protein, partial [Candidatus Rokuibacteriota bacterium]
MPNRKRFSVSEEGQICERYQQGESLNAIAQSLKTNSSTIWKVLCRHQIPRRPAGGGQGRKPIIPKEIIDTLSARYAAGETLDQLAEATGFTRKAITGGLHRATIELRRRGYEARVWTEAEQLLI